MDYSYLLEKTEINEELLPVNGFEKLGNSYFLKEKSLTEGFAFELEIQPVESRLILECYDEFNEKFTLFNVEGVTGKLVISLKEEGEIIIHKYLSLLGKKVSRKQDLLDYIKEKYNTIPDNPFSDDDTGVVLRAPNGKWYGIIMDVSWHHFIADKKGSTDVVNLKIPTEQIPEILDGVCFFPAYHMQKKYWVSVALTKDLDFDKLCQCVDISYSQVMKK